MNTALFVSNPRRSVLLLVCIAFALLVTAAIAIHPQSGSSLKAKGGSGGSGSSATYSLGAPDRGGVVAAKPATGAAVAAGEAVAMPAKVSDGVSPDVDAPANHAAVPLDVKIIQTAGLTLRIPRGDLDDAFARAASIARTSGGYVVSSNISATTGPRSATITMRVPQAAFDRTLASLRKGGSVRDLQITSQDVTQEYVDTRSRLRHDHAVEARLLALLAKTTTVGETLAVQARLDSVQEQIEVEQGRLNYLDQMTSLSTIELTLQEKGKVHHATSHVHWGIGAAIRESAQRFVGTINAVIVALGGLIPALLILAALAALGRMGFRRYRGGNR